MLLPHASLKARLSSCHSISALARLLEIEHNCPVERLGQAVVNCGASSLGAYRSHTFSTDPRLGLWKWSGQSQLFASPLLENCCLGAITGCRGRVWSEQPDRLTVECLHDLHALHVLRPERRFAFGGQEAALDHL
jgi:hypothetical protein